MMNIDELTIGQVKQITAMLGSNSSAIDNKMTGKYVIIRCRDAGIHAGILESYNGRECVLTESRRLWYWKAAKGAFLSSVAIDGIAGESKVGKELPRIHLTENSEIIECTKQAEKSIREQPTHNE
jgi:hypothetical protein